MVTKFESDVVLGSSLTLIHGDNRFKRFESDVVLGSSLTFYGAIIQRYKV